MSDLNPYEEGLALELQAAQKRIEALTEQLAAARKDAEEAEAYADELEAKLAKAVERLTGAAKRMVAVWETPFTGASRRDAREQQDKAVDAAVSNIRAALSATTEASHE